ncbi:hypothetical protein P8625_02790 [Tenacibaculum tangerinum]|uniref:Tetratricopeptide repeat protein n=1 Tax=Tenacibaculum tangerinum TaxID=3038772 RepID=A0ABY8L7B4_9FLAO|nr:hypothetical protein [Tenacibaculum tangerinum]WGH76110.1 hypothetical protein P8625_02790 [Tenacibaculum tangerinum]
MKTLANNYIFKALDAFPYDLEEAVEALTYALAYEEKNVVALCLMGRIYAEHLGDFEKAKKYYTEALAENMYAFNVYPHYINVLLWNEDYEEVKRFIDFARTVKGSDKAILYVGKAQLHEQKQAYKKSLHCLKLAKRYTYNDDYMRIIKEHTERVKDKLPKKKKKKSKKKQK